jgi:hypothetical protein
LNFFKRLFSSSNLELQINDGGRAAAGYKGKAGDCVVRSIAIVTNLPYQKIYDDLYKANEEFRTTSRTKLARSLKQKNDSPRSGTHRVVVKKYLELFNPSEDPDIIIIDFVRSKVIDQSALKAIEDIADKYNSYGKRVKLRHLTRDCHKLLSKAGQLVVDSDDDPDYGVAVDYDVKLGIFGK